MRTWLSAKAAEFILSTNAWKLKLPESEWAYFYTTLEPGATAFTPVRNLNRKPSEGFSLAADDNGNVTACWLSDKLYANLTHDNGNTFAPLAGWLHLPAGRYSTIHAAGLDALRESIVGLEPRLARHVATLENWH